MQTETTPIRKNKRPLIFAGVGVINTLIDFTFYSLLTLFIFKSEDQIAIAGVISGTVALVCAFLTHSFITWREKPISHQTAIKFFIFTGIGMWIIRPFLLSVFIKFTGLFHWVYTLFQSIHLPFSYDFICNTGAFGFMALIVLVYNYFVYQRFVFLDAKTVKTD